MTCCLFTAAIWTECQNRNSACLVRELPSECDSRRNISSGFVMQRTLQLYWSALTHDPHSRRRYKIIASWVILQKETSCKPLCFSITSSPFLQLELLPGTGVLECYITMYMSRNSLKAGFQHRVLLQKSCNVLASTLCHWTNCIPTKAKQNATWKTQAFVLDLQKTNVDIVTFEKKKQTRNKSGIKKVSNSLILNPFPQFTHCTVCEVQVGSHTHTRNGLSGTSSHWRCAHTMPKWRLILPNFRHVPFFQTAIVQLNRRRTRNRVNSHIVEMHSRSQQSTWN